MATSSAIHDDPVSGANAAKADMKFEAIVIPVADVEQIVRKPSIGTARAGLSYSPRRDLRSPRQNVL